jgi:hypothetical protein
MWMRWRRSLVTWMRRGSLRKITKASKLQSKEELGDGKKVIMIWYISPHVLHAFDGDSSDWVEISCS